MLRITVFLILTFFGAVQVAAQAAFSMADVPQTANDALYILLTDDRRLEGRFFARARDMPDFDVVRIPLKTEEIRADPQTPALHQKYDASVVLSYRVTPQLPRQDILTLEVVPQRIDFSDNLAFNSTMPGKGLTIKQNGLRRLLVWDLTPSGPHPGPLSKSLRLPDVIAFGLPKGYQGRTLPGSGSMFDPAPTSGPNPVVFTNASLSGNHIQIAFDLPEPAVFQTIVANALKFVGMLLPVLLLRLTQPDKINDTRFRLVSRGLILTIVSIYSGLIGYSLYLGAPIREILVDLGFAIATVVIAALTAWLLQKNPAPAQTPPAI